MNGEGTGEGEVANVCTHFAPGNGPGALAHTNDQDDMTLRTLSCLTALCFISAPGFAQDIPNPDSAYSGPSTRDALADGQRAAEQRFVGGRALVGTLAGLPLGFFGSLMLVAGPQPELVAGAALGGTGLILARRAGDTTPHDSLAALAAKEGPVYEQAWRAGYSERLGQRRRRAANVGGALGALIGAAFIAAYFLDPADT